MNLQQNHLAQRHLVQVQVRKNVVVLLIGSLVRLLLFRPIVIVFGQDLLHHMLEAVRLLWLGKTTEPSSVYHLFHLPEDMLLLGLDLQIVLLQQSMTGIDGLTMQ